MARKTKRGRPRKPYQASWGEHVNGLRRRSDGRWVIVDTGKTFVEADERRAVTRFKRWEADRRGETVAELIVGVDHFESSAGLKAAVESGALIHGNIDGSYGVGFEASLPILWAWFREQLIDRPEYVAEQVGISEVARLAERRRRFQSRGRLPESCYVDARTQRNAKSVESTSRAD